MERLLGRIKHFDSEKGFGFITPDNGNKDVFVHFSALNFPGFKNPEEGLKVSFYIEQGQKGESAKDVTLV